MLLQLYHRLPAPLRSWVASARGYHLRTWRYGADTERLIAEAEDRERWTAAQWQAWQQARLAVVLHRAATQVPYYREQWAKRRRRGDRATWEELANWPVLDKEPLRANPRAFLADGCDPRRMFHEHTSGTTGKSLDLWWSRETVQAWYACFELRWRRWYGVSRHDRWAILGGQLVVPSHQRQPPFWVWNAGLHQLYLSAYHLAPRFTPAYLDALVRHRVTYLWGYPSALYTLALDALRLNRRDVRLRVVVANAEPVFDHQRQAIAEAFHCPVRETYGMSEIVTGASECSHGRLHAWPEAGLIEVLEQGQPVTPGHSGELIGTGLLNADMPLIRYRVGDRGAWLSDTAPCPCGRTLPAFASIDGRQDDVLWTADGRPVGRLDPVFKGSLPVREAQIIQETLQRLRVRYVPAPGYTPAAGASIVERLQARMGPVAVVLEAVPEVPRTANGKFRAVVCGLSAEEKQRIRLGAVAGVSLS
jgi:phenylacetate-CoA ligase